MYLYFFQWQDLGSGGGCVTPARLHVLDAAGELGWPLERVGLSGEEGVSAGGGFTSRGPGTPASGKAPGLAERPASRGTLASWAGLAGPVAGSGSVSWGAGRGVRPPPPPPPPLGATEATDTLESSST